MKRLLVALLAVVVAASASAAGTYATFGKTYVFTTVDAFSRDGSMHVTGILDGDAAPSEIVFLTGQNSAAQIETCERGALLAMSKPGAYVLSVWTPSGSGSMTYCKLARAVP